MDRRCLCMAAEPITFLLYEVPTEQDLDYGACFRVIPTISPMPNGNSSVND